MMNRFNSRHFTPKFRCIVLIAINEENIVLGFIWVILNGIFHSFPYLHDNSKLFLVVADFNPRAKNLYKSIGYKEIGSIPDLYKKGVTEFLMMKEI